PRSRDRGAVCCSLRSPRIRRRTRRHGAASRPGRETPRRHCLPRPAAPIRAGRSPSTLDSITEKRSSPKGPTFGLLGVGLLDGTEAANRWFLHRVDHDALDWSVRAKLLDLHLRLGQLTSITAAHPD